VGVRSPISEAAAACNQLAAWGVPDAHLWLEPTARSTEESAVFVSAMARRQGWQTLLVVTDDYHVLRSQLLFGRLAWQPCQHRLSKVSVTNPQTGFGTPIAK
jgi:uncharacterized SAM-binding protein YcdF (DUF218 family)